MSGNKLLTLLMLNAAILLIPTASIHADGLIVPVRPDIRVRGSWSVDYHKVDIRLRDQVASISVDQKFRNTGSGMIEVEYLFPVPPGAAIDSMTLLVGGKEFTAKLLDADKARKIYEDIVRKKKDPALLEYAGYGLYRTRAFPLEPDKPVRVQVTYKYVCKQDGKTVEVWYPLNTEKYSARRIAEVSVTTDIKTKSDISTIYSPSHEITCNRKASNHVIAEYRATNTLPTTDFQLFYRAEGSDVGATMLTYLPEGEDFGHYLMLVSPNPNVDKKTPILPKDLVIVMDRSGSMSGKKIRQAIEAVKFVVSRLNKDDQFNVISYSDSVETVFKNLVPATPKNIKVALEEIDAISASGGTDIDSALKSSMGQLASKDQKGRPRYVMFLTDGQPTIGVTDTTKILNNAKLANQNNTRLFTFGVGYRVNVKLLDKLSIGHRGISEYVKPKESVESKISSLYRKIKNPVVTNLHCKISDVKTKNIYPRELGDLYHGDQLVIAGRYNAKDVQRLAGSDNTRTTQLLISGNYMGKKRIFEYNIAFKTGASRPSRAFVEKIWATRRVGFLLDQIQLNGKSEEIVNELIAISKRYGIMTPYTSFLADETTVLNEKSAVHKKAVRSIETLSKAKAGASAQMGAAARKSLSDNSRLTQDSAPAPSLGTDKKGDYSDRPEEAEGVLVFGNSSKDDYEAGKKERVRAVRNIGNQALYQRGKTWVAANASEIDLKEAKNIVEIERFSKKYFLLVKANTAEENLILSTQAEGEDLVIKLRGQVYRIK